MSARLGMFAAATWRGTTNSNGIDLGISFDTPDGVVRLRLNEACARHLSESIAYSLDGEGRRTKSHSEMSSGMPSVEGSPNDGQSQEPDASSSAALSGL
jgi:hypothetical protein